ncbi:Snare region anchored in the vesicle membrane C-terminus [Nesidiocoris tenuis]|uniref:Snare region anchored in the vesicle membrane C-terminus n=1 Tax=Nesidiocoris tenuis TaxID=355587 RepID=A0ABN7B4C2_9HEMI|nr:Snare region anchored in the vesicle membrane C-terminus [Nesidiocoris tenuis]
MWEQRQRESLLEGRAALERTSESLRNSELIAVQTETIGTNVLGELNVQRETLVRAQNRLADIDTNLSKSRQLLNFMKRSVFMNKILLIFVIVCEIGILACLVYLKYLR